MFTLNLMFRVISVPLKCKSTSFWGCVPLDPRFRGPLHTLLPVLVWSPNQTRTGSNVSMDKNARLAYSWQILCCACSLHIVVYTVQFAQSWSYTSQHVQSGQDGLYSSMVVWSGLLYVYVYVHVHCVHKYMCMHTLSMHQL